MASTRCVAVLNRDVRSLEWYRNKMVLQSIYVVLFSITVLEEYNSCHLYFIFCVFFKNKNGFLFLYVCARSATFTFTCWVPIRYKNLLYNYNYLLHCSKGSNRFLTCQHALVRFHFVGGICRALGQQGCTAFYIVCTWPLCLLLWWLFVTCFVLKELIERCASESHNFERTSHRKKYLKFKCAICKYLLLHDGMHAGVPIRLFLWCQFNNIKLQASRHLQKFHQFVFK